MSASKSARAGAFISYSHKDKEHLDELQKRLSLYLKSSPVTAWDDTMIQAGTKWRDEIKRAIDSAQVAILLISVDFIASKFIRENELPPLLAAAQQDGLTLFPIILRPVDLEVVRELEELQTLNPPSQPLIGMTQNERETFLLDVARRVRDTLNSPAQPGPVRVVYSPQQAIQPKPPLAAPPAGTQGASAQAAEAKKPAIPPRASFQQRQNLAERLAPQRTPFQPATSAKKAAPPGSEAAKEQTPGSAAAASSTSSRWSPALGWTLVGLLVLAGLAFAAGEILPFSFMVKGWTNSGWAFWGVLVGSLLLFLWAVVDIADEERFFPVFILCVIWAVNGWVFASGFHIVDFNIPVHVGMLNFDNIPVSVGAIVGAVLGGILNGAIMYGAVLGFVAALEFLWDEVLHM